MLNNYLDRLVLYFFSGIPVFVVLKLIVYLFHRDESPKIWIQEIKTTLGANRSYRQKLNSLFDWIFLIGVFCLIWPVMVAVAIYGISSSQNSSRKPESSNDPRFVAKQADLIKQILPIEAESINYFNDPLGRVPLHPFGHLHKAWASLLSHLEPTDQLWSFTTMGIKHEYDEAPKYQRLRGVKSGYAVVRNKKIVAEFICQWD